jgi:uncharacterized phage-associated protein
MSHQYQLLLSAFAAICIGGVIVMLTRRRPAAKKFAGKKRAKRKAKRKVASASRKRAVAARRRAIDSGSVTTHNNLPDRTANARDVAAYVVQKIGPVTPMKLNRLIAICQAAAIAEDGRPLFADTITASPTGPIPTLIFKEHAGKAEIAEVPDGQIETIVPKAQERIDTVLERCGAMDEHNLNRLTCTSPWRTVRQRAVNGGGDPVFDQMEFADVWKMIAERIAA